MGLEKISQLRKENGFTIEQVADEAGIPVSTIKKISAGITSNPSFETVLAISKALGCSLEEFMDAPIIKPVSIAEQKHLDKYRLLDDRGKSVVDGVLDIEYKYIEELRTPKVQDNDNKIIK